MAHCLVFRKTGRTGECVVSSRDPKGWHGSKRYRQVLNRVRRAQEKQELRRIAQGDREPSFPLWRRADEW
jgi:hypothetical protein